MAPRPFQRSRKQCSNEVQCAPSATSLSPTSVKARDDQIQHIITATLKKVQWMEHGPPVLLEALRNELEKCIGGNQWTAKSSKSNSSFPNEIRLSLRTHYQRIYDQTLTENERQVSMNIVIGINKSIEIVLTKLSQYSQMTSRNGRDLVTSTAVSKQSQMKISSHDKLLPPGHRRAFGSLSSNAVASRRLARSGNGAVTLTPLSTFEKPTISLQIRHSAQALIVAPSSILNRPPYSSACSITNHQDDSNHNHHMGTKYDFPSDNMKAEDTNASTSEARTYLSVAVYDSDPSGGNSKANNDREVPGLYPTRNSWGKSCVGNTRPLSGPRSLSTPSQPVTHKRKLDDPWESLTSISFSPTKTKGENRVLIDLTGANVLSDMTLLATRPVHAPSGFSYNDEQGDEKYLPHLSKCCTIPAKREDHNSKNTHWTEEDDDILRAAIQPLDGLQISQCGVMAEKYSHGRRSGKQCQTRWTNYLQPSLYCKSESGQTCEDKTIVYMATKDEFSCTDITYQDEPAEVSAIDTPTFLTQI
jgi:hypothetical protein